MLSNRIRMSVRALGVMLVRRRGPIRHSVAHTCTYGPWRPKDRRRANGKGDSNTWKVFAAAAVLGTYMWRELEVAEMQPHTPFTRDIHAYYDLHETPIGTGGFGHVCTGVHKETGERVAVKLLRKSACARERVLTEVEILRAAGEHQSIIAYRDKFEDANNYYIVMEMATGGEIFDQLVRHGAYSEAQAMEIIRAVAEALSYLHEQHILHLDLKPENIMLSTAMPKTATTKLEPGDIGALIRLVDFGSATFVGENQGCVKHGSGTVAYSAPELFAGEWVTSKADVWALGVIMFILLRGFHPYDPFNEADDNEMQQRIQNNILPMKDDTWNGLSPSAKELVQSMLARDPNKRPSIMEVVSHRWFDADGLSEVLLEHAAENLRRFHRGRRRLKAVMLAVMADLLPADVKHRISVLGSRRAAARFFDVEGKGYITTADLSRVCALLGEGTQLCTKSIKRKVTRNRVSDADEMARAAEGNPYSQARAIRYDDLIKLLPPLCPSKFFEKGEFIFTLDEDDPYFYLLKSGEVRLCAPSSEKPTFRSQPRVIETVSLSAGQHFGELELMDPTGKPPLRGHAAKCCSERCEVFAVPPSEFFLLVSLLEPVNTRLAMKNKQHALQLAVAYLRSHSRHKDINLEQRATAKHILAESKAGACALMLLEDGKLTTIDPLTQLAVVITPGRPVLIASRHKEAQVSEEYDWVSVFPEDTVFSCAANADGQCVAKAVLVPLYAGKELLEGPRLEAIRLHLPLL